MQWLRGIQFQGKPPISLSPSVGLARNALRERRQQRWIRTVACKNGCQHLSRIKPDAGNSPAFFVGSKSDQRILARLRFGHSALNASTSRFFPGVDELCKCAKEAETASHFLLRCNLYNEARKQMLDFVKSVCNARITEEVLLGCNTIRLSEERWGVIVHAVARFVRATRRDI